MKFHENCPRRNEELVAPLTYSEHGYTFYFIFRTRLYILYINTQNGTTRHTFAQPLRLTHCTHLVRSNPRFKNDCVESNGTEDGPTGSQQHRHVQSQRKVEFYKNCWNTLFRFQTKEKTEINTMSILRVIKQHD